MDTIQAIMTEVADHRRRKRMLEEDDDPTTNEPPIWKSPRFLVPLISSVVLLIIVLVVTKVKKGRIDKTVLEPFVGDLDGDQQIHLGGLAQGIGSLGQGDITGALQSVAGGLNA